MKEKIIKQYIDSLSIQDIESFARTNNIQLNKSELDYLYHMIKNKWRRIIYGNPDLIFNELKAKISPDKYNQLYQLYQTYYNKYSHYL